MLAEEKAMLVPGIEEFGRVDRATADVRPEPVVNSHESMLVARLRAGDISAFEDLVYEYQPLVYALSLRILADPEDARDTAQETFLKVYRNFDKFRGEASLKTWICRIAINQARSTERWWRRRFRSATSSLDDPHPCNDDGLSPAERIPSSGATPEAEAMSKERGVRVERALGCLKKDFRIAVILRDLEGWSYEEIAYTLELSIGTVKSRIARGREMLRNLLQQEEKGSV
ncbi:MAG: sigma-70 family RNA polymerase sigma factor [Acidobacteria bacterium]|nr:sigma-70 family RNA polymerase sigma factor [Acidobacteriota bacterium]MCW5967510.1 sigma-70 family RNA polymerase sigma factor [Blastocatellales bacterium]